MANTTVYPFGTGGELPSSIGIVNDCVTGGSTQALSAEQGKVLYNEIHHAKQTLYYDKGLQGDGTLNDQTGYVVSDYIEVDHTKTISWYANASGGTYAGNYGCLVGYNSSKEQNHWWSMNDVSRSDLNSNSDVYFIRATFKSDYADARIEQSGNVVWSLADAKKYGVANQIEDLADTVDDVIEDIETLEAIVGTGDFVKISVGKNLCDPSEVTESRRLSNEATPQIKTNEVSANSSVHCITGYIPIRSGQVLVCNSSAQGDYRKICALFANKGDTTAIANTGTRFNIIYNNLGYDAYAVFCYLKSNAEANGGIQVEAVEISTPSYGDSVVENVTLRRVLSNGSQLNYTDLISVYEPYSPIAGYQNNSGIDYRSYGDIGKNYPKEIDDIVNVLSKGTRLRFVHVSDNHGDTGEFNFAMELTDASSADFFVHTGDIVSDVFSDNFSVNKTAMLAMTKPSYIVLGNHDCCGSASLEARYKKFIEPLNEHNGLTSNTKTYYSVDHSSKKIKCIFLDMCDAIEGSSLNMSYYTHSSKMTSTQIGWFITQLQDALTNNYTVVCFIHIPPGGYSNQVAGWHDAYVYSSSGSSTGVITTGGYDSEGVHFLADIVAAFISKESYSVTHDGNTYSGTFTGSYKGKFAGWFCGHTHYDIYGTLEDHPEQHYAAITQPFASNAGNVQLRIPNGNTADFVTVDDASRMVCIYRVGCQTLKDGSKRKSFYYHF